MKIAFDIHGVLDHHLHFRTVAKQLYELGVDEIYIISGQLFDSDMQDLLYKYKINFHKYFSITQELIDRDADLLTWLDGKPYAADDVWNKVKAEICEREGIHVLYDDSTKYGKYFSEIDTLYMQVHNGHWSESGRECREKNTS